MTKGYTKEQLEKWKTESFDKIHWYISHADVIITEDMYNEEEQQYDFEELYYLLREIIYEFEYSYMSSEIEEEEQ